MDHGPKVYRLRRSTTRTVEYAFPGLSEFDRGYIAGIIDGEGSIYLKNVRKSKQFYLCVGSTTLEMLHYLQDTLEVGEISEQSSWKKRGHKPMYVWNVWTKAAVFGLACEFCSVLKIKRPNAERIIRFANRSVDVRRLRIARVG